ncbi:uncharacterized protein BO97DRAFT_210641 [Aspergillus homomorphus CBS 101889]|uniref:Uncharacterized protein n=1 Tax=Aspergillus homomorphus (strain CBS 101889) TaxID=1450537 RepID=A0A395I6K5_ASPHC|nr:hypothetical protein BO97DRAFT_210641 [Aspergillus homomorphus CBS 101889]RAL15399.1 hypothetical protein BO97DRAFT_210641 [Aspergillus homomorphus CBS 101889]
MEKKRLIFCVSAPFALFLLSWVTTYADVLQLILDGFPRGFSFISLCPQLGVWSMENPSRLNPCSYRPCIPFASCTTSFLGFGWGHHLCNLAGLGHRTGIRECNELNWDGVCHRGSDLMYEVTGQRRLTHLSPVLARWLLCWVAHFRD